MIVKQFTPQPLFVGGRGDQGTRGDIGLTGPPGKPGDSGPVVS